jgi:hypothetical protein
MVYCNTFFHHMLKLILEGSGFYQGAIHLERSSGNNPTWTAWPTPPFSLRSGSFSCISMP